MFLIICLLVLTGCTSTFKVPKISDSHPAYADAEQKVAAATDHMQDDKMPQADHVHMHEVSMSTDQHDNHETQPADPSEYTFGNLPEPVSQLLYAIEREQQRIKANIDEQALSEVHEITNTMDLKLSELQQIEVPANPHIWHMHASELGEVKAAILRLKQMQDLSHGSHYYAMLDQSVKKLLVALDAVASSDSGQHDGHHGGHR